MSDKSEDTCKTQIGWLHRRGSWDLWRAGSSLVRNARRFFILKILFTKYELMDQFIKNVWSDYVILLKMVWAMIGKDIWMLLSAKRHCSGVLCTCILQIQIIMIIYHFIFISLHFIISTCVQRRLRINNVHFHPINIL